jgi:hypothetical protein
MNNLWNLCVVLVCAVLCGCSAMRYEVQVSYSPAMDCAVTARVMGN